MSRYAGFLVMVGTLAWAQQTRPSIVEAPIDFTPESAFGRAAIGRPGSANLKEGAGSLADRLASQFHASLMRQPGLTVPLRASWMKLTREARHLDWDRSNGALGRLAQDAKTLYAMYVSTSFGVVPQRIAPQGDSRGILMVARVVNREGRAVGAPVTVFEPAGGRQVEEVFQSASAKLFEALDLGSLPLSLAADLPSSAALAPPPSPPLEETRVPPPPSPAPVATKVPTVEVAASEGSMLRTAEYMGLGVGCAAVIGGAALFVAAPHVRKDATGGVFQADLGSVRTVQGMQGAGIGLIIGGAVVAGVSGSLLLWGPRESSSVKAAVMFTSGGATLVVGGTY